MKHKPHSILYNFPPSSPLLSLVTSCTLFLCLLKTYQVHLVLSVDEYRIIYWNMDSNLKTTSLNQSYSPSLSSYQYPVSSEPVIELQRISVQMYKCPVVHGKLFAYSCSPPFSLTVYSCCFFMIVLEPWKADYDINISFRVEHSRVSYSLHIHQLWVSMFATVLIIYCSKKLL